jgi:hypothetical protein
MLIETKLKILKGKIIEWYWNIRVDRPHNRYELKLYELYLIRKQYKEKAKYGFESDKYWDESIKRFGLGYKEKKKQNIQFTRDINKPLI